MVKYIESSIEKTILQALDEWVENNPSPTEKICLRSIFLSGRLLSRNPEVRIVRADQHGAQITINGPVCFGESVALIQNVRIEVLLQFCPLEGKKAPYELRDWTLQHRSVTFCRSDAFIANYELSSAPNTMMF